MHLYTLNHPVSGETIVIDRMTHQEARKRNESLERMAYPYRWATSLPTRSTER